MTAAAPSYRERFGAWVSGKRGSVAAIGYLPDSAVEFGPGIGNQPTHEALLRESLGIADTATRAIANRVSTLEPLVKVSRRVMDGTQVDETLDDHRLKVLLDRPHPNFTRSQLLRLLTQHIITVGEGYWLKVGNGFGLPVELHPIPPGNVTPLVFRGVIAGYRVRDGNGKPTDMAADTICRFFFPDPENPMAAEGYLGPQAITVDSLKFSGEHLRRRYEHDATPKTVLETSAEATAFTTDQRERFSQEWVSRYHSRFGKAKGDPAIMPVGYKLIEMMMQSGADVVPLMEFWRDQALMGFGTPRSVLGQVVSGDRSSAETNQYVFDRHAVSPITGLIADGITSQLAHEFDPKIFVEFEDFVSADKAFDLEQETADLAGKVRSVNQVREDRNLDPVTWGDDPVATIGQQPYDPEGFAELQADVPGALGDDEPDPDDDPEDDEPRSRSNVRAFFSPENEWQRQIRREKKFVPAFLKAMRGIFRDQLTSVLNELAAQDRASRTRVSDPATLIDSELWFRLFEIRVEPVRQAAFREIMLESLTGLGAEDAFIFTESMQQMLNAQGAQLVSNVNRTTQKRLASVLAEAAGEGESTSQIAKRIEGVFRLRRRQDSRTIARTEILKASQTAQLESFELADVDQKVWNTNRDPEVRDSHSFAEGQVRAVGDSFDLAGEPAAAPGLGAGGGNLSAANAINCRCFVTPVVDS